MSSVCHFTAAGKYSPYHCSSPLQLLLVRPLGWTLSYKTEKTWKDKCSKCNLRTPTQLLSKWKLWTILTSYLISRISEFTYWWSDNPHPVLMDESNGFCNGMEIIQTCQWSDVIFCTRSDSKWVSRHCFCMIWMIFWAYFCQWECDFLEAKISFITFFCFRINSKVLWSYWSTVTLGRVLWESQIFCWHGQTKSLNKVLVT